MSPFLWTGTIFDFFQVSGKVLVSIQFWNNKDRGGMIDLSHNFNILIDISSYPWALLMSRAQRIFNIWSSEKLILENLASESCSSNVGKTLSFFDGVHFEAKKLLKWSAFLLKSASNLLFVTSGGISGTFLPLSNVFKMDQYVLELVFGLYNFLVSCLW